jgi:hypothetical protein
MSVHAVSRSRSQGGPRSVRRNVFATSTDAAIQTLDRTVNAVGMK